VELLQLHRGQSPSHADQTIHAGNLQLRQRTCIHSLATPAAANEITAPLKTALAAANEITASLFTALAAANEIAAARAAAVTAPFAAAAPTSSV
jgi:hypothetical protein